MSVHVLVLYPRETTKKKKEKKYSLHLLDGSHVNGSVSPLCIDEVVPTLSANVTVLLVAAAGRQQEAGSTLNEV